MVSKYIYKGDKSGQWAAISNHAKSYSHSHVAFFITWYKGTQGQLETLIKRGMSDGFVVLILSLEYHPEMTEHTPLTAAAAAGDLEAVRHLLDQGVDFDARGRSRMTALAQAAWKGHLAENGGLPPSRLGVHQSRQGYIIEFSNETAFTNGVRPGVSNVARGIWTIPGGTTMKGVRRAGERHAADARPDPPRRRLLRTADPDLPIRRDCGASAPSGAAPERSAPSGMRRRGVARGARSASTGTTSGTRPLAVVVDQQRELGARSGIELLLQVAGRVLQHVRVAAARGELCERSHEAALVARRGSPRAACSRPLRRDARARGRRWASAPSAGACAQCGTRRRRRSSSGRGRARAICGRRISRSMKFSRSCGVVQAALLLDRKARDTPPSAQPRRARCLRASACLRHRRSGTRSIPQLGESFFST